MKQCIIVLGMHRSGTSVCAGILSHFDLSLGSEILEPNEENPKGFFENTAILGINKAILKAGGADWDDHNFSLDVLETDTYQYWVSRAKRVIQEQFQYANTFLVKDPRFCLVLPIWLQALEELGIEAKIVIPYRSPMEVAHSLSKRNGFSINKGLLLWARYFFDLEKYSRSYERMFINFALDFNDMTVLVDKFQVFLGLNIADIHRNQAEQFFEYKLKQQHFPISQHSELLPEYILSLIKLVGVRKFDNTSEIERCRVSFEKSLILFNLDEWNQLKENYSIELERTEKLTQLEKKNSDNYLSEIKKHEYKNAQLEAEISRLECDNAKLHSMIENMNRVIEIMQCHLHSVVFRWHSNIPLKVIIGIEARKRWLQLHSFHKKIKIITIERLQKFDAISYVALNNDIQVNLKKGSIKNPLDHYIEYGYEEVQSKKRKEIPSLTLSTPKVKKNNIKL